jgi:hypothetical protein
MTTYRKAHSELNHLESRIDWGRAPLALLTLALIGAAIGLAILGLDAFNDVLARGLSSLSTPSS